jgi:hypothetical protein
MAHGGMVYLKASQKREGNLKFEISQRVKSKAIWYHWMAYDCAPLLGGLLR